MTTVKGAYVCPNAMHQNAPCVNTFIDVCTQLDHVGAKLALRLEALVPTDKLSETKRVEREAKEAHKAELQSKKQKNHDVSMSKRVTASAADEICKYAHCNQLCTEYRNVLLKEQPSKRSVLSVTALASVQQQMLVRSVPCFFHY